jgi:outer membrane lipoprotein-sorting protein
MQQLNWLQVMIFVFAFNPLALALEPELKLKLKLERAELLVKVADEIRNPSEAFEMKIKVEDSDKNVSEFVVYLKGKEQTLIVTKEPSRDRGRNMLMQEQDFHAYVPNLKRSMRLSLSQKLSGQVANGDIARTRWYGDYDVRVEKEDVHESCLFLKARRENLTYAAIRLWVAKINNRPLRAEYLGSNGTTILKKAFFEDYRMFAGALRPSLLRIEDSAGKSSRIAILDMKKREFDSAFFSIRNMETLK